MHDIRAIRADPAAFDAALARRGLPPVADAVLALDAERRAALSRQQEQQGRRNVLAKEVGKAKRAGGDTAALEAEATRLRDEMAALEASGGRARWGGAGAARGAAERTRSGGAGRRQ